jgi:hypothetical protein
MGAARARAKMVEIYEAINGSAEASTDTNIKSLQLRRYTPAMVPAPKKGEIPIKNILAGPR